MMFLPATSEETYVYIKKCEIQWEIEKSLGVKTMMAQCDGDNMGRGQSFVQTILQTKLELTRIIW